MSATVSQLWRHPVKGHGYEALDRATLTAGQTFPWDRVWAVTHEGAKVSGDLSEWASCRNFSRGAGTPSLMAITCEFDEVRNLLTVHHPDLPDLTFNPDEDRDALVAWTKPLMVEGRAHSTRLIRSTGQGLTDSRFPSIAIGNLASHHVIEDRVGKELSTKRWRANIWFDGWEPFQEADLVGKTLRLGEAELIIREPVVRCLATTVNPATGKRDADTLKALGDAQEFCVYAEVTKSGALALGDQVEVI